MKLNKILFSLMAAFSLLAVSCQEEIAYTPGEPDLEGCYGVYFPTQEAAGDHTMDPSEVPAVQFTVKRLKEDGNITVPVNVTASEEGIFQVSELTFADGQSESNVTVTFDNAQPGTEYTLKLEINDPQYALKYGANPTFLTYSVIIERYDLMGTALYREDLLTALFSFNGDPNPEWEVEVYTKETNPGYYYLKNVYQPGVSPLFDPNGTVTDTYMIIDATNPQRVILPFQYLGCNLGYGECAAGSYAPEGGFNVDPSAALYGTLINGVITFPKEGLLFGMSEYKDFGFYLGNGSGMFRVVLPGAVLVDYTIEMSSQITENGVMPLEFTFGADIETIKYAAYAGSLSKEELAEKVTEVAASTTAATVSKPAADGEGNVPAAVVNLSFEKTGEYTIVAVGYDKDNTAQNSASLVIEYVAAGDEVPVVISAGLGSAAKYAPEGYTTDNAIEFYMYGSDIKDIKIGLFTEASLIGNQQGCINTLLSSTSLPQEVIDMVNEDVYVDLFINLTPGTKYYMLVYAANGYEESLILTDPYSTTGDPLPVYQNYDAEDIKVDLLPTTSEGYFGTYNYYAKYEGPLREYFGQVTIVDSEYPDLGPDENGLMDEFVEISGLFAGLTQTFGVEDDTMIFDYYGGVIYALENPLGPGSHSQLGNFYLGMSMGNTKPSVYVGYDNLMIGGFVEEGYIAFVTAPSYAEAGYTMDSFFLMAYSDEAYQSPLGYLDYITNPLLVDPSVDDNGLAPAQARKSMMSREDLSQLSFNINSDINYVETERGHIRTTIDKMLAAEKTPKAEGTRAGIKGEWSAPVVEFTAVEAEPVFKNYNTDYKKINDAKPALYR